MIENILSSLRRGADRARARGEEVAQATRLRFEVFQLGRELDALYGRLGRAYHSGAPQEVLLPIREEIARVDEEIAARERLIAEIQAHEGPTDRVVEPSPAPVRTEPGTTVLLAKPPSPGGTTMTDDPRRRDEERATGLSGPEETAPPSIERNRLKDQPNQDYQERVDEGQGVSGGTKTDADLHGSPLPIPKLGSNAANDLGIDRAPVAASPNVDTEDVHERNLRKEEGKEADLASKRPDPLDD